MNGQSEMESIQGAEWVFWIPLDQIDGLAKADIVHGRALQPASIDIFKEGSKQSRH
jgi:hypothetical protein